MFFLIKNFDTSKDFLCSKKVNALSTILQSYGKRKLLVVGDRDLLKSISSCEIFSAFEKIQSNDILNFMREIMTPFRESSIFCSVDFSDIGKSSVVTNSGRTEICFGYGFLESDDVDLLSRLIVENYIDADFYNFLAKFYSKIFSKSKLGVRFEEVPGGGSQIKETFYRERNKGRISLCLVDSDRFHPQGPTGSTARAFSEDDFNYSVAGKVYALDVNEAESIIHLDEYLDAMVPCSSGFVEIIDRIKKVEEVENYRDFFDHKNGISLKKAIELDSLYGDYWLQYFSKKEEVKKLDCYKERVCSDCGECPMIPGAGDDILRVSTRHMRTRNYHKVEERLNDRLKYHWNKIGELLYEWGCVPKGKPSRS